MCIRDSVCAEFNFDDGDCDDQCGVPLGDDACVDECGVPFGDNTSCAGCDGVPNSGLEFDYCGICDGDNVANECEEAPSCGDDEFDCLGDGTECIPASWECDIYWADCSNGADEANCGGDDTGSGDCVNDDSTSDAYGDTCSSWYDVYEGPGTSGCLGAYDTDDFIASEQCCASVSYTHLTLPTICSV